LKCFIIHQFNYNYHKLNASPQRPYSQAAADTAGQIRVRLRYNQCAIMVMLTRPKIAIHDF